MCTHATYDVTVQEDTPPPRPSPSSARRSRESREARSEVQSTQLVWVHREVETIERTPSWHEALYEQRSPPAPAASRGLARAQSFAFAKDRIASVWSAVTGAVGVGGEATGAAAVKGAGGAGDAVTPLKAVPPRAQELWSSTPSYTSSPDLPSTPDVPLTPSSECALGAPAAAAATPPSGARLRRRDSVPRRRDPATVPINIDGRLVEFVADDVRADVEHTQLTTRAAPPPVKGVWV